MIANYREPRLACHCSRSVHFCASIQRYLDTLNLIQTLHLLAGASWRPSDAVLAAMPSDGDASGPEEGPPRPDVVSDDEAPVGPSLPPEAEDGPDAGEEADIGPAPPKAKKRKVPMEGLELSGAAISSLLL